MELVITINTPVGEFTPDMYIGNNWKRIFDYFSSDSKEQELSEKAEKILEEKYNLRLGEIGDIYRATYVADTRGEAMDLFKDDIQKALIYMREEALPSAYGDDSFFDYVPDFCEQVAQMIYQYDGPDKGELVNGWANNMSEFRYFDDELSEYMSTTENIEDQVKAMEASHIGPFHDNLVSMGLIQVTINEVSENEKK